jgi:ABC-type phosphate transport system permease subunit
MTRGNAFRRAQGLGRRALCAVALCLALSPQSFALAQSQPGKPIIVKIIPPETKSELSGLADVLLGSLGLTGIIVVAAVLLGVVMAGVMFWVRSRESR